MRRRININGLMAQPTLENDQVVAEPQKTPPAADTPPVTEPVEPAKETPPADAPAADAPAADTPPVETPPVETPPVETSAADTPPVETPPVEAPVETPPVEKIADAPAAVATPDNAVPITPAAAEPAPGANLTDMSETVEVSLQEAGQAEVEIGQVVDEANQAVEVAEALESLRDVLQASVPEGGIDRNSAGALKIAVEALYDSVGVRAEFPEAEKFASISGRMRSTQVAMEGVSDVLKKIWEAIVRVVKASVQWLTERFQMLFVSAEKIEQRAMDIAARAAKVKNAPKSTVFKNASFVKALHIDGKVNPMQAVDVLQEQTTKTMANRFKNGNNVYDTMADLLDGKGSSFEPTLKALFDFMDDLKPLNNASGEGLSMPADIDMVRRGPQLPGGKAMVAFVAIIDGVEKDIEEATKRIMRIRVELMDAYNKVEVSADQELSTLVPGDVADVAKTVAGVARSIAQYKSQVEAMNSVKKRIIQRAEAQAKTVDAAKNPEGAKAAQSLAKLAPWALRVVEQPCAGFTLYTLNTCKTVLDYCTVSLKESEGITRKGEDEADQASTLAAKTQEHLERSAALKAEEEKKKAT